MERLIVGKCPHCGGDVVKVCKGWKCVKAIADSSKCSFNLSSLIGNRRINDFEAQELLVNRKLMLDGFSTKEGKIFATILNLNDDGTVKMESVIGKCPRCGGNIHVGNRAFNCSNFARKGDPCGFVIWRNIGGHDITLKEAQEICEQGATAEALTLYDDNGEPSQHKLGLTPEKDKVTRL